MSSNTVRRAVKAFQTAWKASIADYSNGLINSERCLQAVLYHHLREALSGNYRILIEAKVKIGKKPSSFIDILIIYKSMIVVAAELKYKPKSAPVKVEVARDLSKLIRFRNRKSRENKCKVALLRYQKQGHKPEFFRFSQERRIIFAAYCRAKSKSLNADKFWIDHRPLVKLPFQGYKTVTTPKLIVCLARTDDDGTATPEIFGQGRFSSSG